MANRILPPVVSGHNAFHDLARPSGDVTTAVVLVQAQGEGLVSEALLHRAFDSCVVRGELGDERGVPDEEEGTAVLVCRGPARPWVELWPEFGYVGLSTFCHPCRRLGLD